MKLGGSDAPSCDTIVAESTIAARAIEIGQVVYRGNRSALQEEGSAFTTLFEAHQFRQSRGHGGHTQFHLSVHRETHWLASVTVEVGKKRESQTHARAEQRRHGCAAVPTEEQRSGQQEGRGQREVRELMSLG